VIRSGKVIHRLLLWPSRSRSGPQKIVSSSFSPV